MEKRRIEILAPAGSYASFKAAINAGADAVYAGGPKFGARAYADNFTKEELIEAIKEAHIYGRKLYLTVNTLLKNNEISELPEYLSPLYEAGLDAVIVQDIGVLELVREYFPKNGYSCEYADDDHRVSRSGIYGRAGNQPCCSGKGIIS